ncbi:hypothetical protein HYH03_015309 [Edaphochlamys debaryana]|uniref:Tr-type G domain-containing protein n=1 Tax=Edaphochlamys debaryana TaxID=47281 RepID=A0A835XLD6_9CHLO|nr:hypothetical protein HYH03_015309 [Edaphochlamys debaryana]|eukprot:KAG2485986.1 hypothetical protein HYH03_015309 [Edaphochlamys debaryana]
MDRCRSTDHLSPDASATSTSEASASGAGPSLRALPPRPRSGVLAASVSSLLRASPSSRAPAPAESAESAGSASAPASAPAQAPAPAEAKHAPAAARPLPGPQASATAPLPLSGSQPTATEHVIPGVAMAALPQYRPLPTVGGPAYLSVEEREARRAEMMAHTVLATTKPHTEESRLAIQAARELQRQAQDMRRFVQAALQPPSEPPRAVPRTSHAERMARAEERLQQERRAGRAGRAGAGVGAGGGVADRPAEEIRRHAEQRAQQLAQAQLEFGLMGQRASHAQHAAREERAVAAAVVAAAAEAAAVDERLERKIEARSQLRGTLDKLLAGGPTAAAAAAVHRAPSEVRAGLGSAVQTAASSGLTVAHQAELEAAAKASKEAAAAEAAAAAAANAQAVAAAEAMEAELAAGSRYCDAELTHAPPDDEPYLGDRDAALQAAEEERRQGLSYRLTAAIAAVQQRLADVLTWRPSWGAVAAPSAPAAPPEPLPQPTEAATGQAAAAEVSGPGAVVTAAEREALAQSDREFADLLGALRQPAQAQAGPGPAAAAMEAAAAAAQVEVAAAETLVGKATRLAEVQQAAAAEAAAAAQAAAASLRTRAAAAAEAGVLRTEAAAAAATPAPTAEPAAATAAAEAATPEAPASAAAAAPAASAPPGPSALLSLLRSQEALVARFIEARAAEERRQSAQRAAEAQREARRAAAEAAAAAGGAGGRGGPKADALEGLFQRLGVADASARAEELRRASSRLEAVAKAKRGPGAGAGAGPNASEGAVDEAASSSGFAWSRGGFGSGSGSGFGAGGRFQKIVDPAAEARRAAELEWAKSMASAFAAGDGSSASVLGSASLVGPNGGRASGAAAAAAAAEQEAAEAEAAAREAAEAEAAAGEEAAPSGRRSLFGEPQQITLPESVTVRSLAALLGVPPPRLEAFLREQLGEAVRSDREALAPESAELAALEFGRIAIRSSSSSSYPVFPRQPVVTILGHVDHGKTSLLDALRRTNVAAGEAGGITQHIGAFEVRLESAAGGGGAAGLPDAITFVDTPGHEAFSAMRARGAAVTDVAVLVVAADEGVKPQTREALAHARSAGCPVVVAITKCDKATARPDYVKAQLASEGLDLEDFGGSVQVVHTSATTGEGLRELEEALLLAAELMELRAPREGPAAASVIEARTEKGLGPVATVIVKRGTLRVGDPVVVGTEFGRVRALRSEAGGGAAAALGVAPGQYALVSGLEALPQAGDELLVVPDEARARLLATARRLRSEEYRRLQLAGALAAQRQREAAMHAEEYARRRALKSDSLRHLAERKKSTAQSLQQRAAEAASGDAAAAAAAAVGAGAAGPAQDQAGPQAGADTAAAAVGAERLAALPPVANVNLVIKADVQGSVEAVVALVESLAQEQLQEAAAAAAAAAADAAAAASGAPPPPAKGPVAVKVVHAGVGAVTPSDVHLAVAAGACLVAFNTRPDGAKTESLLKASGVPLLSHAVVYHLMDALRAELQRAAEAGAAAAAAGAEPPLAEVGAAEVLATFALSSSKLVKDGKIAGVRVLSGEVAHGPHDVWRVVRGGRVVWEGPCTSLRHHKQLVPSVASGLECGVVLGAGAFSAFEVGDRLVCLRRGGRGEKDGGGRKEGGAGGAGGR